HREGYCPHPNAAEIPSSEVMMRQALLLAPLLLANHALAAPWSVDPASSKLIFHAEQSGEKFSGSFPKFNSEIDFDETAPEKGRIHITVDTATFTIDGSDRTESFPTSDWFAVKQFPTAEFTSAAIKKTGEHQFIANGNLTIRGVNNPAALPFTLKTTGKFTIATGELTINRNNYGVGQGRWATDEWIKSPVRITYEVHAIQQ
ncbi:MAG: YceI family protein, partial [Rickettsiales bacterium]